ncbi:MAG: hypothetical protein ACJAYY_000616 [Paraglaciecola sp.]|jgi:hypothetical protein
MYNNENFPVDAVITWVDSTDVVWQNNINKYLENKIDWNNENTINAYHSINEIEITIISIIKNARFIKNIYLVTDNQQPKDFDKLQVLAKQSKVNLVVIDHKVIFKGYEHYLPTFNAITIETLIFRIPNLNEHFLFFNDDFFLMKETKIEDFFIGNATVIRGKWDSYYEDKPIRKLALKLKSIFKKVDPNKGGYKLSQQNTAKLLELKKYLRIDHTPVAIKKSSIEGYFKLNPKSLDHNIKYKFRHKTQFLIMSLSNHLEIKKNTFILKNNFNLSYYQSYNYLKVIFKLFLFDKDKTKKFMCFQMLVLANKKSLSYILNWIDKKLDTNFSETMN